MAETSNTSTSVGIVLNGKDNVSAAFNSATKAAQKFGESGLGALNEKLERIKSSMRGFNSILELGFGFQIGRKIFDQMHEGVVNLAEGFSEAREKGLGFADSVEVGMKKMLGYRTQLDIAADATKHFKEVIGDLGKEFNTLQDAMEFARTGVKPSEKYPNTPGGKDVEEKIKSYQASIDARQVQLEPYYTKAQAILKRRREATTATEKLAANREMDELDAEYGPTLDRLGATQSDLTGFKNEAERNESEWKRKNRLMNRLKSLFIGGNGLNGALLTGGIAGGLGALPGQIAGGGAFGALAATGHDIASIFNWHKPVFQDDPGLPPEINQKIDALRHANLTPQQRSIESAKLIQGFGSYFGLNKGDKAAGAVGAENSRFLTRGSGPIKTPELTALEKIQKAMEDLATEKLPDLLAALKAFGPIGVIDN